MRLSGSPYQGMQRGQSEAGASEQKRRELGRAVRRNNEPAGDGVKKNTAQSYRAKKLLITLKEECENQEPMNAFFTPLGALVGHFSPRFCTVPNGRTMLGLSTSGRFNWYKLQLPSCLWQARASKIDSLCFTGVVS